MTVLCRIVTFTFLILSIPSWVHAAPAFPTLTAIVAKGEPITVVCFGDSVTGLYYHTGGRRAYTDMVEMGLELAWPEADLTAINAGISGHTTLDALARIEKDVLAKKPDLVTVMFGLNDMTRVPLEDYRKNLMTIIEKCRGVGAEVLLCTPNSIRHTDRRPVATLEEYVAVVRDVAGAAETPLADCNAAFKAVDVRESFAWSKLMSDEIHPNMGGHKKIAETIVTAVTGKTIELDQVPAPTPPLLHVPELIASKKPLRILAMPPYDAILLRFFTQFAPESELTVDTWDVAGRNIQQIKESAKGVRDKKYDLVFIAVPATATAESPEAYQYEYGWVLNYALSFGHQEWDVVAVPPSLAATLEGDAATRDEWQQGLIRAQDFTLIEAVGGSEELAEQIVRTWLKEQLGF